MRVEKGKVHAPEIGRVWLNSAPLTICVDPVASALQATTVPAP
jgi:hypothetical protein